MKKRGARIKHSRYRADPPIVRAITDQSNEIAIRMAVASLAAGTATTQTIDTILQHLHLLQVAVDAKGNPQAAVVCEVATVALDSIIDRYKKTGRFGATGEERKAVELLMDESIDFWKRQSGMTRDACVLAVNEMYGEIIQSREQQREAA